MTADEIPYVERADVYSAHVTYPAGANPVHVNPLGLPLVRGRKVRVMWEDLELVVTLALWDFGAVRGDHHIERIAEKRPDAWWLDGVLCTQTWAQANYPRPTERGLLDDLFPRSEETT